MATSLVVEEAGVPGENQRPWTSNWLILSLAAASQVHSFCNLQSRARTLAVLVIGLYELLGNPTTQLIEPPGPHFFVEIILKLYYCLYNIFVWFQFCTYLYNNMRQVQPETLPKNSNYSSCLQNIKLKNNTT